MHVKNNVGLKRFFFFVKRYNIIHVISINIYTLFVYEY